MSYVLTERLGGWLDQVRLKLTQSPPKVGVEVGTELGNVKFDKE